MRKPRMKIEMYLNFIFNNQIINFNFTKSS